MGGSSLLNTLFERTVLCIKVWKLVTTVFFDKLFFNAGLPVETSPEEQTASCEGSFYVLTTQYSCIKYNLM